jgi:hypothetical protein
MKQLFSLFFCCTFVFSGCLNVANDAIEKLLGPKQTLFGTWQLSKVSKSASNEYDVEDRLLKEAQDNEMVKKGLILSFFPDNTFTQIKGTGEYIYNNWRTSNNEKEVFFGDDEAVSVEFETINKQKIMNLVNPTRKMTMTFVKNAETLEAYTEDPFYHINNTWRIKPTQSESAVLLHERLGNYIKHLAFLLQSATLRKESYISFVFSQGIVKIYNGGIGVQPFTPESWTNTYYNAEEAALAKQMFSTYLNTTHYSGKGVGNWYVDDYDILTSIYGDVKAGKFPQ